MFYSIKFFATGHFECMKVESKVEIMPCSPPEEDNKVWILKFDGSRSKKGAGAGVELIFPKNDSSFAAYRLQFPCTNNVAEYEALIFGL